VTRKIVNAADLSREEIDRALDQDPFFRRIRQHCKAGMSLDEAYDFTLAEELAKGRPWSSRLLDRVAERFLEKHEPRLKAQWERDPARDREKIDALAEWLKADPKLKAKGFRAYRSMAEEMWAGIQGVTVHALRKRRQRRK